MKMQWLARNGSRRLLMFFAGWGMDARPFEFLETTGLDVVVFSDYTDEHMPIELDGLVSEYDTVDMAAWSFGVAVAQELCLPLRNRLERVAAIGGTVLPIHHRYGIRPDIFAATLGNLSADGIQRFRRRMCGGRDVLARFSASVPARGTESLTAELTVLGDRFVQAECADTVFTCAWVTRHDRIIPAQSQVNCWDRFGVPYSSVEAAHFAFYQWSAWEELLCPRLT